MVVAKEIQKDLNYYIKHKHHETAVWFLSPAHQQDGYKSL
jgi:hypothetical protein